MTLNLGMQKSLLLLQSRKSEAEEGLLHLSLASAKIYEQSLISYPQGAEMHDESESNIELRVALIAIAALFVSGLLAEPLPAFAITLYFLAAIVGVLILLPEAKEAVSKHVADINVLMVIAVIGALVLGFYETSCGQDALDTFRDAAIVILLYQIGEFLEDWAQDHARDSIKDLLNLSPKTVHVVRGDKVSDVSLDSVKKGQVFEVYAGERVPLDGCVVSGKSFVSEAPVTGEVAYKEKDIGANVFAGSLNKDSLLRIEATSDAESSSLAEIVRLVEEAEAKHSIYEKFIDRFAAVYTPLVIFVSYVVAFVVPLVLMLFGQNPDFLSWVWRGLVLLVISCPCALVISTPVTFVSALSRLAHKGILVKGGSVLDKASRIDTFFFDKTGTLTEGDVSLPEIVLVSASVSEKKLLAYASVAEEKSTHPLAKAIVANKSAVADEIEGMRAVSVSEFSGKGVETSIEDALSGMKLIRVGSLSFVTDDAATDVAKAVAKNMESQGLSPVAVSVVANGSPTLLGFLGIAAEVNADAKCVVKELKQMGKRVVMLTGDNTSVAESVGRKLGLDDVFAELLPVQKLEHIEAEEQTGKVVSMVGDGINDAPALALADVGVAVSQKATDTALSVADVALLGDGIKALPYFLGVATSSMRVVKENIVFALLVKFGVMVLAICGIAGMGLAIFADTGVMLLVVLNSLRLLRR